MTRARLRALDDDTLVEQLVVELMLGTARSGATAREVKRRGLLDRALARCRDYTREERRRRGEPTPKTR